MKELFPLADLGMHSLVVVETSEEPRSILLGRKIRGFGEGKLVLPGGKSDQLVGNASPFSRIFAQVNAQRELLEETGVQALLKHMGRLAVFDIEGEDISIDIFATKVDQLPASTLPENDITELTWHAVDAIPYGLMPSDYSLWLPHVLNGETINGQIQQLGDDEVNVHFMFAQGPEDGARMRVVA